MAKKFVPLGLDPNYCDNSSWGKAQGVREFLQNGKDAETQYSAPLTVRYDAGKGLLTITNTGASIPRSSIRLGSTSKRDDARLIGVHGEGGKVGALALLRAGCKVTISTGEEVWEPAIEDCELYGGAPTFGFHVTPARSKGTDKVVVTITNISAAEWAAWQKNYLWLPGGPKVIRVCTETGDLLTQPEQAGRIYVKGVLVQIKDEYSYGYDFHHMTLDRDRQLIDSYDLNRAIAKVFNEAGQEDEGMLRAIYQLLSANKGEVASMDTYSAQFGVDAGTVTKLREQFAAEHGADAAPVLTDTEREDALAIGKKPVVVSRPLHMVLGLVSGSVSAQRKALAKEIRRSYPQDDLSEEEQAALTLLGQWLAVGDEAVAGWTFEVVDFKMSDVTVLASAQGEAVPWVRVAKDALADAPRLISAATLALHNAGTVRAHFLRDILEALVVSQAAAP